MGQPNVLARVRDDLAQGNTHLATQRLRTYLSANPHDLRMRDYLAAIYRQTGNLAEAGRWSFLCPGPPQPAELAAFERATPSPWLRLRMLRFNADPALLHPTARARLVALVEDAEREGPPPIWNGPVTPLAPQRRHRMTVPCLWVLLGLAVVATLVGIGVYRAVLWVLNL